MTDQEIQALVAKYIIAGYEDDNADCLHEVDGWPEGEEGYEALKRGYSLYRSAKVSVTWDDGEAGTNEPSGAGPDSPPASESGVPGATGEYQAVENRPDDSWRIEHLVPF